MTTPLLVFDLDGTLLETAPDLIGTLNCILAGEGLQPIPYEIAKTYIGQGAKMLLERGFAANDQQLAGDRADELFALFLTRYEARIAQESHPFPGLLDALEQLAQEGWAFAVCTNKLEYLARMLLDQLELSSRFVAITGGDTFSEKKPHPDHLLKTIELANSSPDKAIMVGDSRSDIDAAKAAKVPVIAVDFGYTPVPVRELAPDIVISKFSQIHAAIRSIGIR